MVKVNILSSLPFPTGANNIPVPSGLPGNLKVLNWAGFTGAVSYTFDDSTSSQLDHYTEMQALGIPMTFYMQTNRISMNPPDLAALWSQIVKDGHEIGNHTNNHTTVSAANIDIATDFIQNTFGADVYSIAYPYGDTSYVPLAKTRFFIGRGVADGNILPNDSTDPYNLKCDIHTSSGRMDFAVDSARSVKGWRIILVHGFTGGNDGAYQPVNYDLFAAGVVYAKSLGDMWIDTVTNIGAYWRAQKILSSAKPVVSGNTTTWNWTLPDHFPPGKYLRVTVDGGTPYQNDKVLEWNGHGYYEVSLDAGSLTLAP